MAVTLVIALASYFLLEQPIRRGTMIKTGRQLIVAGVAGAAIVTAVAFVVTLDPPQSQIPYADQQFGDQGPTVDQADPGQVVTVEGPVAANVVYFGDSSAKDASPAISAMFRAAGTTNFLNASGPGFGLTNPKLDWRALFSEQLATLPPDVVVMMEGFWDLDYLAANGEAAYEAVLEESIQKLTASGANVVWVGMVSGGKYQDVAVNDVAKRVAERHPDDVLYVDVQDALAVPDGATVVEAVAGSEQWPGRTAPPTAPSCCCASPTVGTSAPPGPSGSPPTSTLRWPRGWMPVAAAGWEAGDWRQAALYDDPVGGCTAE